MKLSVRLGCWATCLLLMVAVSGCGGEGGPKTVKVKGKITKDGAAVSVPAGGLGTISFNELVNGNIGAEIFQGIISADGTFEVDVAPGKYRVAVLVLDKAGGTDAYGRKYDAAQSTIEKEVTGAVSDMEIALP
ncbi:MAG: hypothetical protein AB7O62_12725 [Pirellulales bacterium]